MAGNFAIVVVLPTMHRVTVKVTQNTSVLEVLEDVCRKKGLDSKEWDLKHYNRIINLSNSLRFSGLPNNATLEMVHSTKPRSESTIKLGLQLESGKRLLNQFFSHQTLWEVLEYWESKGEQVQPPENVDDIQPVCIYMRQEIVGKDKLQEKTLRSLGLTQGSAMIRLVHRSENAPLSRASVKSSEEEEDNYRSIQKQLHTEPNTPHTTNVPESSMVSRSEDQLNTNSFTQAASQPSTSNHPIDTQDSEPMELEPPSSQIQTLTPISNAQRYSVEGQLNILGDRDAVLYHSDDIVVHRIDESLPDTFYEVTLSDVDAIYKDLQNKRKELEEAPLQTKAQKDMEKDQAALRSLHDHPMTVVRVRFPNRYVLQGKFRTIETIETVVAFVRVFLANPDLSFYLFTAPPKNILHHENRLVEVGLVGMAVMYFGCEENSNNMMVLKPEVYQQITAPDMAYQLANEEKRKKHKIKPNNNHTA